MSGKISIFDGYFGLERETLRVDESGRLAQSPHPFGDDEHITRDFCENQIEIVTPVCRSIGEALDSLEELDSKVRRVLEQRGEHVWLYSNPPYFENEDEIPIADFSGADSHKTNYRLGLEKKYGKRLMLFSGIHFNFSFSEDLLDEWNTSGEEPRAFRDSLYLRLYKQLIVHSWLLVLMTASSSYYDASLDEDGAAGVVKSIYSSVRNSDRGYWNSFIPILDHSSIRAFADSISSYVDRGELFSASELYLPIRLKPRGENSLGNLARNGVDHIELRMFDLDPSAPLGIDGKNLEFAHAFMIYLLSLPDFELTEQLQKKAVRYHREAALAEPAEGLIERGHDILSAMREYFKEYPDTAELIDHAEQRLDRIAAVGNYDDSVIFRQAVN